MKTFRIIYKDSSVQVVTGESVNKINEPVIWEFVGSIEEIADTVTHHTPLIDSTFILVKMGSGKLYLQHTGGLTTDDVSGCKLMNAVDNHITHLECHIDELNRKINLLNGQVTGLLRDQPKSTCLTQLRELCGHVEDGTDTPVVIFQDDTTRSWYVRVGHSASPMSKVYTGETIALAIQNAYTKHPK
jgi:hypothetical protein